MKPVSVLLILLFVFLGLILAVMAYPGTAQALPEYASQTGEPCATCHLSPSGGGPRGPRGQAWVGDGKPSTVPALVDALELLGVRLEADPKDFQAGGQPVQPAQPLQIQAPHNGEIHDWLKDYGGN